MWHFEIGLSTLHNGLTSTRSPRTFNSARLVLRCNILQAGINICLRILQLLRPF